MCKVLITGPQIAPEAMQLLQAHGAEVFATEAYAPYEELLRLMEHEVPDALIVRMGARIDKRLLDASPGLRVISNYGIGVDNIDLATATARGIPVLVTPGANAVSVAEHALAFILALSKDMRRIDAHVRAGGWDKSVYRGWELAGSTLGLVGFGHIARYLTRMVQPLNMRVHAYDPHARQAPPEFAHVNITDDLNEMVQQADVLSLHCPYKPETHHIINRERLKLMKPNAVLINTARGGLVDEEALVEALKNNRLQGAGLDTFTHQPLPPHHPLRSLPNVILSPHVAGLNPQASSRVGLQAVHNLFRALEGQSLDPNMLANPELLRQ